MARGKLRIYLGAAPGVGKTYAMLSEAHRRVERGTDCVVAFVEHHGRPRTEVMLHGLEQIARRELEYRDTVFTEMDVDAVLARHPHVVLVDELAHTNVPGSRNDKRWQDVEELLAAGINVISTVNIQHLESLGDVVESITGVRQRETVPDEVIPMALGGVPEGSVDLDIPETLPMVAVDRGLMERSVANVVENAVKYSPAGTPVLVSASAIANRVEVRVVDRGPGVPDEAKDRIFEPFQRYGDAPRGAGVGLGLAVARGFAEAIGGTLHAEDTPGGGLTMVLSVPMAASHRPPSESESEPDVPVTATS
ncbi:ATP-binding protein [Streptomyces europaeiscabiei]|uniref:histidine kinase n=1 Tax=Streptomyces europaeiscabiei TaxID=146819 RepID=A0AAJ2PLS8_9ACTN|nr:ATP-binding protein [Streptomyces europaeiscabiei]MDX3129549.1 ATP-binding protein [Streptomyces europaeiscabiei]